MEDHYYTPAPSGLLRDSRPPLLGEAATEWLAITRAGHSSRTAALYGTAVCSLLAAIPAETLLPALTLTAVTAWIGGLYAGHRRSTVSLYAGIGRLFLRWCYRQGWLVRDLAGLIDLPRREQTVRWPAAPSDAQRLFAACETDEDRLALLLLYGCGMRVSEVIAVAWADVDLAGARLRVRGKGSKQRWVGLPPATTAILGRLRGRDRLLHWTTPAGLRFRIRRLCQRAGLARLTPHQLRHGFAHEILLAGGSVLDLRDMLGHENLSTTQIYLRALDRERAVAAMRELSPASRLGM